MTPLSYNFSGAPGRRAWLDPGIPLLRLQIVGCKNKEITGQ